MKTKVYCGRGFAGSSVIEIKKYYLKLEEMFTYTNIEIVPPQNIFDVSDDFTLTKNIEADKHINNKTVTLQDVYLIDRSDLVYINFECSTKVSIGSICELAIAFEKKKHTVVCISKNNINYHAFVETFADYISDNEEDCIEYILKFG